MRFVTSIFRLASANVALLVAQSATIITLGIIADQRALGIFFVGQTTAQLVATFATLRLDSAFPAASDRAELNGLLVLAGTSIVAMLAPLILTVSVLAHFQLFEFQALSIWNILAIALLTAMIALQQLGRYWAIRHGRLRAIEHATYARATAILVIRAGVIAAILLWGFEGLPLATTLLAAEVALLVPGALTLLPRVSLSELREACRPQSLKAAFRKNWIFPAVETPSTMIDSGTQSAPVYLVTQLFGLTATASFGLAYRAMAVPIGQLALAVTEAMQSQYAGWIHQGRHAEMQLLFHRSSALFAGLGVVGCLLAWFALEPMVIWVAGAELRTFAQIAVALAPWIAANVVVNANSRLIPLLKRQDLKLVYDLVSASMLAGAWFAQMRLQLPLVDFVALMAGGQALAYVVYWLLIRHALIEAGRRASGLVDPPH